MKRMSLLCLILAFVCVTAGCKKQPRLSEQTAGEAERAGKSSAQTETGNVKKPTMSIHQAAGAGFIDLVRQHIAGGTDVNIKDEARSDTALHWAAEKGQKEVAELLISKDAYIDARDRYGQTPLHRAAAGGYKDVVELLIAKGANANVQDRRRRTPLRSAADKGHKDIVALLREHGAKE